MKSLTFRRHFADMSSNNDIVADLQMTSKSIRTSQPLFSSNLEGPVNRLLSSNSDLAGITGSNEFMNQYGKSLWASPTLSSVIVPCQVDVRSAANQLDVSSNSEIWYVYYSQADTADQGSIWWDTHLRHMDITAGVHDGSLVITKNHHVALWWILHLLRPT